jgi:isoleucyl-tRNA synthetase
MLIERETLDVWFISGISHMIFEQPTTDLTPTTDLYLEGKDQHRGWFSSSLITSVVLNSRPCTSQFLTHGFCLNSKGEKFSKSKEPTTSTSSTDPSTSKENKPTSKENKSTSSTTLENTSTSLENKSTVVPTKEEINSRENDRTTKKSRKTKTNQIPLNQRFPCNSLPEVLQHTSTDIFRLWVSTTPFQKDILITPEIIQTNRKLYMKFRKTFRNLLGHLHDYEPRRDMIPVSRLGRVDQFVMSTLFTVYEKSRKAMEQHEWSTAVKIMVGYFKQDLRSFYLENAKNRLYFESTDSFLRRSAQTVLYYVLYTSLSMVSPYLSYLAEEVYQVRWVETGGKLGEIGASIHLQPIYVPPDVWKEVFFEVTFFSQHFSQIFSRIYFIVI